MRIREAMREQSVQADESFIGRTTTLAGDRRQPGYLKVKIA